MLNKVSINFGHLQFPIGILLVGFAISIISAFFEKMLNCLKLCRSKANSSSKPKVQKTRPKKEIQHELLLKFKNSLEKIFRHAEYESARRDLNFFYRKRP